MLPTKETVRKTTCRNSRCLALALRAQSRGVLPGLPLGLRRGLLGNLLRASKGKPLHRIDQRFGVRFTMLLRARWCAPGGRGRWRHLHRCGEVAEATSRAVNNGADYGSPSGKWRRRLGFLARVSKMGDELVQHNGKFDSVHLFLPARAKQSGWWLIFI
jgi:hypothetical protein